MGERRDPYTGDFIEALDLEKPVNLTISKVHNEYTVKAADKRVIDRIVLEFEGTEKKLILNKTNFRIVWALYGKKRDAWVGKTITLVRRYVEAFGEKDVMAVRILPPKGTPLPLGVIKRLGTESPS